MPINESEKSHNYGEECKIFKDLPVSMIKSTETRGLSLIHLRISDCKMHRTSHGDFLELRCRGRSSNTQRKKTKERILRK